MDDNPQPVDPGLVKYLRLLVTVLTGTMIIGFLVIIVLFVIRFSESGPVLPDQIILPEGTRAQAFTQGPGWYGVVTEDNRILIYSETGSLLKEIEVDFGG